MTIDFKQDILTVRWINNNLTNKWIPTIIFIHVVPLLFRPEANLDVILHIVELNISKTKLSP